MSQAEEALFDAVQRGDLATLKRLVEEGVDLEAKDIAGETALINAAYWGKLDCLEYLIAKGAKLDATQRRGVTALMFAANNDKLDCLEYLIAKGAKLDATTNYSKSTALHGAAYNGHAPCVEALLKAGADARLKDDDGKTALDIAKKEGRTQIIALLENAAAIAAQAAERAAEKAAAEKAAAEKAAAERAAAERAAAEREAAEKAAAEKAAAEKAAAEKAAAERALTAAMPWPFQLADPARLQPAIDAAKKAGVAGPTIEAAEAKLAKAVENAKKAAEKAAAERAAAERAAKKAAAERAAVASKQAAAKATAEGAAKAAKASSSSAISAPGPSASEDEQLAWALRQSLLEQGAPTSAPPAAAPPGSAFAPAWVVPSAALRWERELGRGGFGAVYEVVHGGVRLAGKKMSLTVAGERARIEALLKREFRALQQAQHPHIVRLHGVVTDDPTSVSLLMELSPIGSLRTLLDQRPDEVLQSEVAQLALLTGIALGMAHLHAQQPKPILHHDLKAANVLVWPDASTRFVAKISDFGLATGTYDSTMRTAQGAAGAATLAYKAPEAFDDKFTTASEVYAFGIVAWEVLTAKVPWEGYSQAKLTMAIIKEERPPLPPQGDFRLVKSCWAQEPKDRPTFAKLARDLQAAAAATAKASEVPKSWTGTVDPLKTSVVELQPGAEYDRVTAAFMASLGGRGISVVSVSRVQSLPMWTTYTAKRRSVLARESQISAAAVAARYERVWLFHGTDEDTVPKICQMGFNRSFCGKNATAFGKGVYFARDASYSSSTTYSRPNAQGVQHMFLARVVIGEYCGGVRDALAPPARDGAVLFDSTVNDVRNPTIFVTYHDAQAYPDYLVQFRQ